MYGGNCVEKGYTKNFLKNISHPYSKGLFSAIPTLDTSPKNSIRLKTIPGTVPEITEIPPGCTFQGRCDYVTGVCKKSFPGPKKISDGHEVFCFNINI